MGKSVYQILHSFHSDSGKHEHFHEPVMLPFNITELQHGSTRLTYTYRSAWFQIQSECSDLQRTRAHLYKARHLTISQAHQHQGCQTVPSSG